MPVRPGYRGSLRLNIANAGLATLSVRTMSIRETIANHDTAGTANPVNAATPPNMFGTQIQGITRIRLSVGAQYSASGAGDPPQFGGTALYGNIGVIAQAGDLISLDGGTSNPANFMVEDYANSLNVDATIDYDMNMISNGQFVRTTVGLGG